MRISDWSSDVCSSDLFPRSGSSRNSGFGVEQGFRDADRNVAVGKYFLPFQFHWTETNEIVACASIGSQCVQSFSGGRVHVDHGTALLPRATRFPVPASSEEGRVGKGCVRTGQSRCAQYNYKKNK